MYPIVDTFITYKNKLTQTLIHIHLVRSYTAFIYFLLIMYKRT